MNMLSRGLSDPHLTSTNFSVFVRAIHEAVRVPLSVDVILVSTWHATCLTTAHSLFDTILVILTLAGPVCRKGGESEQHV